MSPGDLEDAVVRRWQDGYDETADEEVVPCRNEDWCENGEGESYDKRGLLSSASGRRAGREWQPYQSRLVFD